MVARRGEIWWADLGTPRGSGPGFHRPVLVVQRASFNEGKINTLVVAVVTSNVSLANLPGNIQVSPRDSGLDRPSVINLTQLTTLDKKFLERRVGAIDPHMMSKVDAALRSVLGL